MAEPLTMDKLNKLFEQLMKFTPKCVKCGSEAKSENCIFIWGRDDLNPAYLCDEHMEQVEKGEFSAADIPAGNPLMALLMREKRP